MTYLVLKTLHIISSTILFGTGIGTAFHMWATHLRGDVKAIAVTARNVVLADWLFIAASGIAQPVTGFGLIFLAGYDLFSHWLIVSYALYVIAGICWVIVVGLQVRVARIASQCASDGALLPPQYYRAMRTWFRLGWPAFISLAIVFWLMVAKPDLR